MWLTLASGDGTLYICDCGICSQLERVRPICSRHTIRCSMCDSFSSLQCPSDTAKWSHSDF